MKFMHILKDKRGRWKNMYDERSHAMTVPKELEGKTTVDLWPTTGRLLNLGKNGTYAAARSGEITAVRIGRRWVVPVAPLLKMLGIDAEQQA